MAKRKTAAPEQTEDQMGSEDLTGQMEYPDQQYPEQEPQQEFAGEAGDANEAQPEQEVQAEAPLDEEAQLKARLAELRKQKKDKKQAGKANGSPKPEKVAKEKTPRPPKDEANGIVRPGVGVTREVWDTADMLSKRLGTFVDRGTLTEVLNGKIETGTIHTQYGRWRKYYGLTETRDERAARMAQIRQKKLEDLGMGSQSAETQPEEQGEATQ